jgi:hypothetical protein
MVRIAFHERGRLASMPVLGYGLDTTIVRVHAAAAQPRRPVADRSGPAAATVGNGPGSRSRFCVHPLVGVA